MTDIIRLFRDYYINYNSKEGKNTGDGWISLQCCFCNDLSNHLGYNITKDYFYCWKCGYHTVYDTVQELLPGENTKGLLNEYSVRQQILDNLINENEEKLREETELELPGKELTDYHKNYLRKRKFDPDFVIKKYKIKGTNAYCIDYKLRNRIMIPVFYRNDLVSYQGRDVTEDNKCRYLNCELEKEIIHNKHVLYNLDNCNSRYIIVTEGVFKVWRLGDNSCATFGRNYSSSQVSFLLNYDLVIVYFDPDEPGQTAAEKLMSDLDACGKIVYNIDYVAPDDLSDLQLKRVNKKIKRLIK